MLSRTLCPLLLLPTIGLAVMPVTVLAQTAISHVSVYAAPSAADLSADVGAVHTNMPLVSVKQVPIAAMQSHNTLPSGAFALLPGVAPGSGGSAQRDANADMVVAPEAYGNFSPQSVAPYTTARASASIQGAAPTPAAVGVTSFPWRATGKLQFKIGSADYVCSASLIGPGLLITAAHCVFDYGANSAAGYHTNYVFTPAQFDNPLYVKSPYGTFTAIGEIIASSYYNGTDSCITRGVICSNDIAILVMRPNSSGHLPGTLLSHYGYTWNGYSSIPSFGNASLASVTQLGYPVAFDSGMTMERTDGVGSFWSPDGDVKQTVLGTAMTGGSSGGPWLINFGAKPTITFAASLGNAAVPQAVMGVTSWGYTEVGLNTQGASWFGQNTQFPNPSYLDSHGVSRGAGNIGALVAAACTFSFSSC